MTKDETDKTIGEVIRLLSKLDGSEYFNEETNALIPFLYSPHKKLDTYLDQLKNEIEISAMTKDKRPANHHNEIGKLLEQIAYICFSSLKGISYIKSYQSAGPQYDLLISGDNESWMTLCKMLYIDFESRDILVEVKATKTKVTDQIFSRLCSLLDMNLFNTAQLGVFFTLNGATGFPQKDSIQRQRKLGDSKLRQLMFLVGKNKYIVVLDKDDIEKLNEPGSLVKIILRKIQDIEQLAGKYIPPDVKAPIEKDLPAHLQNL